MTWDEAQAAVQAKYSWSNQKTQYSADWYGITQDNDNVDQYYDAFVGDPDPTIIQTWVTDFENELPAMEADARDQAQQNYNKITNAPFIPGKSYVQDNYDGSYTLFVATFTDLNTAQTAYNAITDGGIPFVTDARYVADRHDGTFEVVVRYPLDY